MELVPFVDCVVVFHHSEEDLMSEEAIVSLAGLFRDLRV